MKDLVQQFLEELQIRNYSQRTILDYGCRFKMGLPDVHGRPRFAKLSVHDG